MKLYEVHMPISNLQVSIDFYSKVVGLELAYEQPHRGVAFMWIGSREESMLGLWGPDSPYGWKDGQRFKSHFAMTVSLDELLATPARLRGLGIEPRGFSGEPTDVPSVIGWMPSAQVYFRDPDGHSLEYITVLDEAPKPDFAGNWTEWCAQR